MTTFASRQQAPFDDMKRLGATATVVAFMPPKRRGRPRKPPAVDRRCTDDFDTVAMAVAGIAGQKTLWGAARERVRRWADRDRALRPISIKVLGFQLEHVNRNAGYDWHAAGTVAADLGVTTRAVENAFSELTMAGYLLREPVAAKGRGKATRPWRTTIPALIGAAREVCKEREAKARAKLGLAPAVSGPAQKISLDPNKKDGGSEQERRNGPEHPFGRTLKEESLEESGGDAADDLDYRHQELTTKPAVGKRALHEKPAIQASREERVASASAPKGRIQIPTLRPSPRFDSSLAMDLRVSIPGGRYSVAQGPEAAALRRRMTRAARGWDLHELRAQYVAWAVSANTPDAIEGFIAWMWRFVQKPAVGYVDLGRAGA